MSESLFLQKSDLLYISDVKSPVYLIIGPTKMNLPGTWKTFSWAALSCLRTFPAWQRRGGTSARPSCSALEYRLEGAFEKPKRRNVMEFIEMRSAITIARILKSFIYCSISSLKYIKIEIISEYFNNPY
jgi:hypothetical protein